MENSQSYQSTLENNHLYNVAEILISYTPHFKAWERPKITQSQMAYNLLLNNWDQNSIQMKEEFKILLLNTANNVLGISNISSGGITGTLVDLRLIFSTALKASATGIILAHNHPSGNIQPSNADKNLTESIVKAGGLLNINVLDHIIVTLESYFSFGDEGLL